VDEQLNTPQKVVDLIFQKVDTNQDGNLSAEELIDYMKKDPEGFVCLGLNKIFLT
jgi:Ca2+-binding EF-hand superfamily protein